MSRMWPVAQEDTDGRIDAVLASLSGLSRASCAILIDEQRVKLNGKSIAKSARVAFGDVIEVEFPDTEVGQVEPTVELPIVFSDDDFVVIDKPTGVAAHPSVGWSGPTVIGSLEAMGHVRLTHDAR